MSIAFFRADEIAMNRKQEIRRLCGNGIAYVFLAATFVCMIGFGIYLMIPGEPGQGANGRGAACLSCRISTLWSTGRCVWRCSPGWTRRSLSWLREKTGSTDGNLGAHLLKLEEAGYVGVEKKFVARKPGTLYRMTEAGCAALARYIASLKELLGAALAG